jgi:hypothetical protein
MNWFIGFFFILVNFVMIPLAVYALLMRFLDFPEKNNLFILVISAALSMPLLSFLLNFVLILFPGLPNILYLFFILSLFGTFIPIFLRHTSCFRNPFTELKNIIFSLSVVEIIVLSISTVTLCSLFLLSFIKPLNANDPLIYFELSRYIFNEKNILIYPFMEPYLNGYYGPSWHPPAFHALLVWSFIFQGNAVFTHLGQLYAPYFALISSLLLLVTISRQNRLVALVSVCLLLSTPLYYTHVTISHIDSFRICCYLAATCWVIHLISFPSVRSAIVLGVLLGLAMRAHSFGLITFPFICMTIFLLFPEKSIKRFGIIGIVCFFSFLVCGFDYGRDILLHKTLLPGTEEAGSVYSVKDLGYQKFIHLSRGISNASDIVFNGLLKGFSVELFGLSYWLMLCSFIVIGLKKKIDTVALVFGLQILFYYSLMIITVLLGKEMLIKNSRYFLLVQPFVVYFAAFLLVPNQKTPLAPKTLKNIT